MQTYLHYTWQYMPQTADTFRPRISLFAISMASALLLSLAAGGWWATGQVTMVPSAVPAYMAVEDRKDHASLSSNTHAPQLRISASGPIWREISAPQRQVLMPLRERWDSMGALTKRRWLVLADRYPKMDESERNKLVSRMNTWASLSAQQRNQARLNFETTKRLSAKELQAKWDAYQALSDAEKKRLLDQAATAKSSKKSKRKLARVVKPKVEISPKKPASPKQEEQKADLLRTTPSPIIVETQPVVTPRAAPSHQLEPLTHKQLQPEVPNVSSQPVVIPQALPAINLPPLPHTPVDSVAPRAAPASAAPPLPESISSHPTAESAP